MSNPYIYPRNYFPHNRDSRPEYIPALFRRGYNFYVSTHNVHNKRWPRDKWRFMDYREWLDTAREYAKARRSNYLSVGERRVRKNRESAEYKLNKRFEDVILHRYGAWPTYKNQIYEKLHNRRNYQFVNPPYYPDLKQEKENWLNERIYRAYNRARQKTKNKM